MKIKIQRLQKVKYQPQTSYNAGTKTINVTWTSINPQLTVNVANYINGLVYKDPITLIYLLPELGQEFPAQIQMSRHRIQSTGLRSGDISTKTNKHDYLK